MIEDLMAYKRQRLPPTPPQEMPKRPVHYSQVTGRSPSQLSLASRQDENTVVHAETAAHSSTKAEIDAMIAETSTAYTPCKFDDQAEGTVCHLHDHSAGGTTRGGSGSSKGPGDASAPPGTINEQDDSDPCESLTTSTAITVITNTSPEGYQDQTLQTSSTDSIAGQDAKYTASQLDAAAELAPKQVPSRAKLWFPAPELYPDVFKPSVCQDFNDLLTQIDVFKASRGPDAQSRFIKVILVEIRDRNGRMTRLRILNNGFHGRDAFEELLEEISALESSANDGEKRSTVDLIVEWEEPGEAQ